MEKPQIQPTVEHDGSHTGCIPCMGAIVRQGLAPWSNQQSNETVRNSRGDHT